KRWWLPPRRSGRPGPDLGPAPGTRGVRRPARRVFPAARTDWRDLAYDASTVFAFERFRPPHARFDGPPLSPRAPLAAGSSGARGQGAPPAARAAGPRTLPRAGRPRGRGGAPRGRLRGPALRGGRRGGGGGAGPRGGGRRVRHPRRGLSDAGDPPRAVR